MLELPGYRAIEVIHEGLSVVVHAVRTDDQSPVILKAARNPRPTPGDVARLRRDFLVSSSEAVRSLVRATTLAFDGERPVVVFEPFAGRPCPSIPDLDTEAVLDIACGAALALVELQGQRIVHGTLAARHVLYDRETRRVKLCGFGDATRWVREEPVAYADGDPDPVASERSGRSGRAVDLSTDLWGLGVVLQELVAVHPWRGRVSRSAFDSLVARLLAENPMDRFPHAFALWEALKVLEHDGPASLEPLTDAVVPPARLGRSSVCVRGRARVFERVEASLGRVRAGRVGWITLSGAEGVGKSAVLAALEPRLWRAPATVVRCEFPREATNQPYFLFTHAFSRLLRRWAAQRPEALWHWRERFSQALGADAAVLVERLPQLRFLLGEVSAGNRPAFRELRWGIVHCLVEFSRLFVRPDRPLVLLLDDWDRADPQSVAVVQRLVAVDGRQPVLVVSTHQRHDPPLIRGGSSQGIDVTSIELGAVAESDVAEIIADLVPGGPSVAGRESKRLFAATGGIPLAVQDALWWAHARGLAGPDPARPAPFLDIDQIGRLLEDTDRRALIDDRLQVLPREVMPVLTVAACLGRHFDVALITALSRKPAGEVFDAVVAASDAGLVVAYGPDLGRWGLNREEPGLWPLARFSHEEVRRRVLAMASPDEVGQWHWKIGQFVLQTTGRDALRTRKFEIARHLNASAGAVPEHEQRLQVARLDLMVARAAREIDDYATGLQAAEAGLAWLPENPWEHCRELVFELTLEWCRCSALAGVSHDEVLRRCADLAEHAQDDTERLGPLDVRIRFLARSGHGEQAVAEACEGLVMLDIPLAEDNVEVLVAERWQGIQRLLAGTDVSSLVLQVPASDDARGRCIESIVVAALHAGWSHPLSWTHVLALTVVERALAGEDLPLSGLECAVAGVAAVHAVGDAELGYRLARAGVARARSQGRWQGSTRLMATVVDWVRRPLRHSEAATMRALQELEKTEWDQLGEAVIVHCASNLALAAASLDQAGRSLEWLRSLAQRAGNEHVRGLRAATKFVRVLTLDPVGTPLPWLDQADPGSSLTVLWESLLACQSALVLGDSAEAVEQAAHGVRRADVAFGWFLHLHLRVFEALAWAAWEDRPREDREERVADALERVAHWSTFVVAENVASAQALLTAELARLRGEEDDAERAYAVAIGDAQDRGSHLDLALATEFAARFHRGRRPDAFVSDLGRQVRHAYEGWGADRKVKQLEREAAGTDPVASAESMVAPALGAMAVAEELARLSDALRVIASAREPEEVIATLLSVVVELSEGERGVVLRRADGELEVIDVYPSDVAEGPLPGPVAALDRGVDLAVLQRAAAKTEPLVVDVNAMSGTSDEAAFRVLCIPLVQAGTSVGLFYLQGERTTLRLVDRLPWLALVVAHGAASLAASPVLATGDPLAAGDLQVKGESAPKPAANANAANGQAMPSGGSDELRRIEDALHQAGGSVAKAARSLGTSRGALSRRMKSLGIPAKRRSRKS